MYVITVNDISDILIIFGGFRMNLHLRQLNPLHFLLTPKRCAGDSCKQPFQSMFTLIEMLIVVAVISILAAMMLPALNGALETSRRAACLNNQRAMYLAFCGYADDNHGFVVPGHASELGATYKYLWYDLLNPYFGVGDQLQQLLLCPSDTTLYRGNTAAGYWNKWMSYGINVWKVSWHCQGTAKMDDVGRCGVYQRLLSIPAPGKQILFSDAAGYGGGYGTESTYRFWIDRWAYYPNPCHSLGMMYVKLDGSGGYGGSFGQVRLTLQTWLNYLKL